jgi:branched-chain amino acid transport system substrate-binding protein
VKAGRDQAKIRDALEGIKNFPGVSGVFNMSPEDHNGLTPDAFVMVKIEKGQFTLTD